MSSRSLKNNEVPTKPTSTVKQAGNPNSGVTVKSNGNAVEVWADYACWDTVANKFVNPEDTNLKDPK